MEPSFLLGMSLVILIVSSFAADHIYIPVYITKCHIMHLQCTGIYQPTKYGRTGLTFQEELCWFDLQEKECC